MESNLNQNQVDPNINAKDQTVLDKISDAADNTDNNPPMVCVTVGDHVKRLSVNAVQGAAWVLKDAIEAVLGKNPGVVSIIREMNAGNIGILTSKGKGGKDIVTSSMYSGAFKADRLGRIFEKAKSGFAFTGGLFIQDGNGIPVCIGEVMELIMAKRYVSGKPSATVIKIKSPAWGEKPVTFAELEAAFDTAEIHITYGGAYDSQEFVALDTRKETEKSLKTFGGAVSLRNARNMLIDEDSILGECAQKLLGIHFRDELDQHAMSDKGIEDAMAIYGLCKGLDIPMGASASIVRAAAIKVANAGLKDVEAILASVFGKMLNAAKSGDGNAKLIDMSKLFRDPLTGKISAEAMLALGMYIHNLFKHDLPINAKHFERVLNGFNIFNSVAEIRAAGFVALCQKVDDWFLDTFYKAADDAMKAATKDKADRDAEFDRQTLARHREGLAAEKAALEKAANEKAALEEARIAARITALEVKPTEVTPEIVEEVFAPESSLGEFDTDR